MTHAKMLKARRKNQSTKKRIEGAEKEAKRLAKQALKGPVVKKEKVKKEKAPKVEKVKAETVKKVKKVKLTAEELGRQESKARAGAAIGKKGA